MGILLNNINKYNNYVWKINFNWFADNLAASINNPLCLQEDLLPQNARTKAINFPNGWIVQTEAERSQSHSKIHQQIQQIGSEDESEFPQAVREEENEIIHKKPNSKQINRR